MSSGIDSTLDAKRFDDARTESGYSVDMAPVPTRMTPLLEPGITSTGPNGDVDIAVVGSMLANAGRCRILLALGDGRALAASQLAVEAGVTPATASSHLAKMVAVGLLTFEPRGRNRYYRITGPQVGRVMELLAQLAPAAPVRSLRQGVRAQALREARTCYDHLAGQLGVAIMRSMIEAGRLTGDDAAYGLGDARSNKRAGYGNDLNYRLTSTGARFLVDFGVVLPRQPVIRYCLDWSERRHHLSGPAGRGLLDRLIELAWLQRSPASRAVTVTEAGRKGILDTFDILIPAEDKGHRWGH
jgi:DNA-binding transcriptional ArsR family regulator